MTTKASQQQQQQQHVIKKERFKNKSFSYVATDHNVRSHFCFQNEHIKAFSI